MSRHTLTLFDPALIRPALLEAFRKFDPRVQRRNPVMFVVYVGSAFTTMLAFQQPDGFTISVSLWLWFTVLFANFAEALAEGRSKAQAASLRGLKKQTWAKRVEGEFKFGEKHGWGKMTYTDGRSPIVGCFSYDLYVGDVINDSGSPLSPPSGPF